MDISTRKIPDWLKAKLEEKWRHDISFAMKVTRFVIDELDALDLYDENTEDLAMRIKGCNLKEAKIIAIKEAVRMFGGNVTQAALYLGIGRSTLEKAITRLGIDPFVTSVRSGEIG